MLSIMVLLHQKVTGFFPLMLNVMKAFRLKKELLYLEMLQTSIRYLAKEEMAFLSMKLMPRMYMMKP